MLIDFRPHARLRGKNPVDFGSAVTPALDAPWPASQADLSRVRVVCDWVQYRGETFRDVVERAPGAAVPRRPAGAEGRAAATWREFPAGTWRSR